MCFVTEEVEFNRIKVLKVAAIMNSFQQLRGYFSKLFRRGYQILLNFVKKNQRSHNGNCQYFIHLSITMQ